MCPIQLQHCVCLWPLGLQQLFLPNIFHLQTLATIPAASDVPSSSVPYAESSIHKADPAVQHKGKGQWPNIEGSSQNDWTHKWNIFLYLSFLCLRCLNTDSKNLQDQKAESLKIPVCIDCLILKFHLYLIFKCLPLLRLSKEKRTSWSIQNSEDFRITWIHSSCFFYFRPHCPTNFALSRMCVIYTFLSFSYSTIFRRAKANCRKSAFLKSHSKDKEAKKKQIIELYIQYYLCVHICVWIFFPFSLTSPQSEGTFGS